MSLVSRQVMIMVSILLPYCVARGRPGVEPVTVFRDVLQRL